MRAADVFDWDPSVKSLLAFPDLLARMDEKIDWTRALGDAFLTQENDVMDAVQDLRRRARLAGSLASDGHVTITDDGPRIRIVFASPSLVYLPYYDSRVVYGRWWWPTHPPVAWAPWPGYRFVPRAHGVTLGFWWNTGVRLSIGFFFGGIDWPQREVRVVRVDGWYVRHAIERRAQHRKVVMAPGRWHHEPTRRYAEPRHAARSQPRPAPQRESRGVEVRRPEGRRPELRTADLRQNEARRPVVRQPESRRTGERRAPVQQTEARRGEERRPVVAPQEARRPVERRPEVRHAEDRRPEPRQRESREVQRGRPEAVERHERASNASHSAPQREARRSEPARAQRERGQPARRERQATTPPAPRQEARPQDTQRSQAAERRGPRGSERGSQNIDDARERGPQG